MRLRTSVRSFFVKNLENGGNGAWTRLSRKQEVSLFEPSAPPELIFPDIAGLVKQLKYDLGLNS
jgi:hypothetical protein